uniref:Uncharacterized protein n=1 Tax=Arundo donax TaxID=35708 RepID=A0A0A9GLS5_ARUDO
MFSESPQHTKHTRCYMFQVVQEHFEPPICGLKLL